MTALSKRLRAICGCVEPGYAVLDVGCDHAYAAMWLVENGIAPCAAASDIRSGPLRAAEEHIREAGLSDRIRTVLADGIPEDYREYTGGLPVCVLLAGMGGRIMTDILERADAAGLLPDAVVASPQRDADLFRRCLTEKSYVIEKEIFLEEDGKYYTVIRSVRGKEALPGLTAAEAAYGPCLLREKDPLLYTFLRRRNEQLAHIERGICPDTERKKQRLREINGERRILGDALLMFRHEVGASLNNART